MTDQVVAKPPRIRYPCMRVPVAFQVVVAAEPGDVDRSRTFGELREPRGAAEVGLDDRGPNRADNLSDPKTREQVPGSKHPHMCLRDRAVKPLTDFTLRRINRMDGASVSGKALHQPTIKPLGPARAAAADDVHGVGHFQHTQALYLACQPDPRLNRNRGREW